MQKMLIMDEKACLCRNKKTKKKELKVDNSPFCKSCD